MPSARLQQPKPQPPRLPAARPPAICSWCWRASASRCDPTAPPARAWSRRPARRLTFSTTTALLRPWLKLWRTTPCSTPPRFNVSVFVELTLSFSPLFLVVSVIPIRFCTHSSSAGSFRRSHCGPIVLIAGAKPLQAPTTRQKGLAHRAGEQGCMYHIWAVQCQIQLRRGQESNHRQRPAGVRRRKALSSLRIPSGEASAACNRATTLLAFQCGFDLGEAGRDQAGLTGDSQSVECRRARVAARCGRRDPDGRRTSRLKPRANAFRLYRLVERFLRRGHPDAAAGQPALDVRHRLSFRPDDKPDQVRDRPHGARGDAQALGRARAGSAVQFDVLVASAIIKVGSLLSLRLRDRQLPRPPPAERDRPR